MLCPKQVSPFLLARYRESLAKAPLSKLYNATAPNNHPARRHAALSCLWDAVTPFACEDDAYDFGLFCREILREARAEKYVELPVPASSLRDVNAPSARDAGRGTHVVALASDYQDAALDTADDLAYGKATPYAHTREQLRADALRS